MSFPSCEKMDISKTTTELPDLWKGSGSSAVHDMKLTIQWIWKTECKLTKECVIFGYHNIWNKEKGIQLHLVPFCAKSQGKKQQKQKKWDDFVKLKHTFRETTKNSVVCSQHCREEEHSNWYADLTNNSGNHLDQVMKRNKIRVCVFVTKKSRNVSSKETIDESRLGIWKVRNISQHHSACLLKWLFFYTIHIALTMLSILLLLLLIFARRPWSTLSLDKACTHPSNSEQQKHSLILCKYWKFAHWDLTLENKLHGELLRAWSNNGEIIIE